MKYTLKNLIKEAIDIGERGPHGAAFWAILNECNAVCTTCHFYRVPKNERKYVTLDDARAVARVLKKGGFRYLSITGGEPLMHPDFFEICQIILDAGLEISYVPTNGIVLDDTQARGLKRVQAKMVGVSVEQIGDDGMGATRKIKNFRQVLVDAREALDRHGVPNYAGVLLSKSTVDMEGTLAFIRELGFQKIVFSYPHVAKGAPYLASREVPEILLTREEAEGMVDAILRAKKTHKDLDIYNSDESLADFRRWARGEPRRYPCWGGRKLFYIDWHLDLYPCFTIPQRLGNVRELDRLDVPPMAPCDDCINQAFRDFGPLYTGAQAAGLAVSRLSTGRPVEALKVLTQPDARDGIRSIWELYRGGFL